MFNFVKLISNNSKKILFIVISLGFILRLIPIFWGISILPYESYYHPDEGSFVAHTMLFPDFSHNIRNIAYGRTVGLFSGILYKIFIFFCGGIIAANNYIKVAYLCARFICILFGTGSIYVLYLLTKILTNNTIIAILAASLLAFLPAHIVQSSVAVPDITQGFCISLFFLLLVNFSKRYNNLILIFLLGLISAMTIGTKVTGLILVPVYWIVFFFTWIKNNRQISKNKLRSAFSYFFAGFIIGIITFSPQICNLEEYLNAIKFYCSFNSNTLNYGNFTDIINHLYHCCTAILPSFYLYFATIGFICNMLLKNSYKINKLIILLMGVVIVYFFILFRNGFYPRYLYPTLPLIIFFCATCFSKISNLHFTNKFITNLLVFIIVIHIAIQIYYSILGIKYTYTDTRTAVIRYLANNLTLNQSIGTFGPLNNGFSCKLDYMSASEYMIKHFSNNPTYVIMYIGDYLTFYNVIQDIKNNYSNENIYNVSRKTKKALAYKYFIFWSSSDEFIESFFNNLPFFYNVFLKKYTKIMTFEKEILPFELAFKSPGIFLFKHN